MNWYRGFESCVRENVPLAPLTTYRVGGPAEFFATPPDAESLGALLRRAHEHGIAVRLLGHGTNLLVSDEGVRGLVIQFPKKNFAQLDCDGLRVHVGAGHSLPALVKWSVSRGFAGLECLQGVPGTVGAALRMNAGGKYGEIGSRVRRVNGFEKDGTPFSFDVGECGFVYRDSALGSRIVMDCDLQLERGDPKTGERKLREILSEKCKSQPVNARSAGCVFKNPTKENIVLRDDDNGNEKIPPAGMLIDQLELKGVRFGNASISMKHANFLIAEHGARAGDLAELIRLIRRRALRERGIRLDLEVETWGFADNELSAI
ncbi:MAG TPA: UDP-N-acetylmuramate dehydrogenase [Planctomycetota bacterium]|nr:UDP-N-acetylmuramate dehydrogenase [Planctomycetota bacterium]